MARRRHASSSVRTSGRLVAAALSVLGAALAQGSAAIPGQVVVLDGGTGAPAPDATVWVVERDHPSRFVEADAFEPAALRLARTGRAFRTDGVGRVSLPADVDAVELGAAAPGRFAHAQFPLPAPNPFVLTLRPDPEVLVHVAGPDGAPAAIPASVMRVYPGGVNRAGWLRLAPDAQGRATLHPAPLFVAGHDAWWMVQGRIDDGARLEVSLDVVAPTRIVATIDERAVPATIRLTAPPCGELVVTVLDDEGAPVRDGGVHAAVVTASGPALDSGRWERIVDGKVRFPAVAVGQRLRLESTFGATPMRGTATEVDGPSGPGDVVATTLRGSLPRGDGRPVQSVRGRLVDRAGVPRGDCAVCVGVWRGSGLLGDVQPRVTSGRDGAFAVPLLGPLLADDELVFATCSGGALRPDEVAVLPRPRPGVDGALDMGDVVTAPAPMLCDVRVVDADGAPTYAAAFVSAPEGRVRVALPGCDLHCDRHGRIVAHAARAIPVALTVEVTQPGCAMQRPTVFASGSKQVVVALARTFVVPGSVRLPTPRAAAFLTVRLVPSATYGEPACGFGDQLPVSSRIAADGSFTAGPAAPGTYHLQVLLADAFEIALVANVAIAADGAVDAARLQALDLTAALREVAVETAARAGAAPAGELELEPVGEAAAGKRLSTALRAELHTRPVRVFVPTGAWRIRAVVGGRAGAFATIDGATVRVALPD